MLDQLTKQTLPYKDDIEILTFIDNKQRSTGQKRNDLIELSQGRYIVFIDDDDTLTDDYISSIIEMLRTNPTTDCVVFDVLVHIPDREAMVCKYGKEYTWSNTATTFYREPAHIMVHRRQLAIKHKFPSKGWAEDRAWPIVMLPEIKNQVRINKVLYHYNYAPRPLDWYCEKQLSRDECTIVDHISLLVYIIQSKSLISYLEIGSGDNTCFNRIDCKYKVGVDPKSGSSYRLSSDEFFSMYTGRKFDLVLVDGLHHSDQVNRDIYNSLSHLTDNGLIIVPNASPRIEEEAAVPYAGSYSWYGDVWKAVAAWNHVSGVELITVDVGTGITVIRRRGDKEAEKPNPINLTWSDLVNRRKEILSLVSLVEFKQWL